MRITFVKLVPTLVALWAAAGLADAQAPTHHAGGADERSGKRALRETMRKLWSDHVFWTRDYVVGAIDGPRPAADAAAERLMRNQEEIGAAVARYYGKEAGDKLTTLLKEHITLAVDVVAAAKAGDQAKLDPADAKWQKNADEIAEFLSSANPNWPRQTIADSMKMHLDTTRDEVVARLRKDYKADVAAFDAVYEHILAMSDVLADGIIRQFPAAFAS